MLTRSLALWSILCAAVVVLLASRVDEFKNGLPGISQAQWDRLLPSLLGSAATLAGLSIAAAAILVTIPDSERARELKAAGALRKIIRLLLQAAVSLFLVSAAAMWLQIEGDPTNGPTAFRSLVFAALLSTVITSYAVWAFWKALDTLTHHENSSGGVSRS